MFTNDGSLILKTMSEEEYEVFLDSNLNYFDHMENNASLISKIYGIYRF